MNEKAIAPSGPDLADAPDDVVDNVADQDDNSIEALLNAAMMPDPDETPADTDETAPDDTDDEADEPITSDASAPPRSWTAAERDAWQEMPESARAAVQRRERDYQAGLRTDAELRKVLDPLVERLQGTGVHADQYVQNLLQADQYIEQQPLQAALAIIEQHGLIDQARQILSGAKSEAERPANSNESRQIAELREQLALQAATAHWSREWDRFVNANPDAEALREVIAAKVGANPALTYADAYAEAKQLVTKLNGSTAKAAERARIEGGAKASQKASRLNIPRGRSDAPPARQSTGSVEDDIEHAFRSLGIR